MFRKSTAWLSDHKDEIRKKTKYHTRDMWPALTTLALIFSGATFAVSYPAAAVGGLIILTLFVITGHMGK